MDFSDFEPKTKQQVLDRAKDIEDARKLKEKERAEKNLYISTLRKLKKGDALSKEDDEERKRYIRFIRELNGNVSKLFGENAKLCQFKDNHGKLKVNEMDDYERELDGKDNLAINERRFLKDSLREEQQRTAIENDKMREDQRFRLK
jgi:hypothetical protein